MRLFVAVDIPESAKERLQALRRGSGLDDLKWVGHHQMHLTLRFIGEVDEAQVAVVKAALDKVAFEPFALRVSGLGQFPPKRPLRVLWAGIEPSPALTSLAADVERQLVASGLPPEDKPFSAHITLARAKSAPSHAAVETFFQRNARFSLEAFTVDRFVLYSSLLSPQGPTYTAEGVYAAGIN
jgi:RNA 2',3'-cyclic 3'-phosphodiesterase